MDPKTGRCAVLFPHGVLFRNEEEEMRRKLVEIDLIECVLGLGPGLFYNSPMEACVVFCRSRKAKDRKRKILFIDAVEEIARERAQSFLKPEHQKRIADAYAEFGAVTGLAEVVSLDEVLANDGKLSLPLYVKRTPSGKTAKGEANLASAWACFESSGQDFWRQVDVLAEGLDVLISSDSAGEANVD
jgi:type I restriction enzyme M protein